VVVQDFPMVPNLSLIQFDEVFNVNEVVDLFMSDPNVEYAEPDYYYHAATLDPLFAQQWALENNGQTGGTRDSDINANSMWAINSGSPSVVVGVIDSGTDYNHPDLIPNLWRNLLDLPGTGIDEDGNGYVDDVYGLNAITNTGNPYDDNSHGTHVAGTIGAKGNNSVGVVGVAQNVQIATCILGVRHPRR
jgi:serine protease